MTRRHFVLANERLRQRAVDAILERRNDGQFVLPVNSRVEIKGPQRSSNQNAAMWAMLGDISEQVQWMINGGTSPMDAEAWKLFFLDALRIERRDPMLLVPNIDRTGFVDISGKHSSDLSHEEMGMLLTLISAFGDQHKVVWSGAKAPKDMPPEVPLEVYEGMRR